MSMEQCTRCQQAQKKLRLLRSDYEFEIKKIQQDKSTQKALYEIYLQKEVRKWQQLYEKQKTQKEDQMRNWMNKYDATVADYEEKISCIRKDHSKELMQKTQMITNKYTQENQSLRQKLQSKIERLIKQNELIVTSLKQVQASAIDKLNADHEQYVSNIKRAHCRTLQQKVRGYESKILGLESEKIKEQKLHEQTKVQSKEAQSKLYQQIFSLRKQVAELEGKVAEEQKVVRSKQEIIQSLNGQIATLKQKHTRQIEQLTRTNEQDLMNCKQEYKAKLSSYYEQTLKHCNNYQSAITKLEQARVNQKSLYLNNIEEINLFMDSRASRPEDIEQIESLRVSLAKKIKQCDVLSEELKFFRLELENKEETYNRIFVPMLNPSNENVIYKRKQFKLRRQGRSVTTVREALQSVSSVNNQDKRTLMPPYMPKQAKVL